MNANLTDITLVVDRSGSMDQIRDDAQDGINTFVAEQAKQPGDALLTFVQFDTEYEFIHRGVPIRQVPKYQLVPRGSTALLDAVGRAVNETGERLAKMDDHDRPGLVIFVVMTVGQENSSKEFSKAQIKEMIDRQQNVYNWHFNFQASNQDAFAEAGSMGIHAAGTADWSMNKAAAAYKATSDKVTRMRAQASKGDTVCNSFTDEERDKMK